MDNTVHIQTTRQGSAVIFRIEGRLAITGTAELEKQVLEAIQAGSSRIVFDCEKLAYVSSAGLRIFFVALKRFNNQDKPLAFVAPQPGIRQIFDIAQLTPHVRITDTLDDALRDLPVVS